MWGVQVWVKVLMNNLDLIVIEKMNTEQIEYSLYQAVTVQNMLWSNFFVTEIKMVKIMPYVLVKTYL